MNILLFRNLYSENNESWSGTLVQCICTASLSLSLTLTKLEIVIALSPSCDEKSIYVFHFRADEMRDTHELVHKWKKFKKKKRKLWFCIVLNWFPWQSADWRWHNCVSIVRESELRFLLSTVNFLFYFLLLFGHCRDPQFVFVFLYENSAVQCTANIRNSRREERARNAYIGSSALRLDDTHTPLIVAR